MKVVFRCEDGALTETVFAQTPIGGGFRNTVCVSSQIGCRRTCGHCSSGRLGFKRDLTTSEIVSQVAAFAVNHDIDQVAFHGMGEPLDNPAVGHAASFLHTSFDKLACSCDGVEYGGRARAPPSVCLSTVGNSPATLELACLAPNTWLMLSVMPDVQRSEPVDSLLQSTDEFVRRTGNQVALSYTMIDGLDTEERADELWGYMERRRDTHVVQLVQYHDMAPGNICQETPVRPSQPAAIRAFIARLRDRGCRVGFGQYCEFPSELLAA